MSTNYTDLTNTEAVQALLGDVQRGCRARCYTAEELRDEILSIQRRKIAKSEHLIPAGTTITVLSGSNPGGSYHKHGGNRYGLDLGVSVTEVVCVWRGKRWQIKSASRITTHAKHTVGVHVTATPEQARALLSAALGITVTLSVRGAADTAATAA